MLLFENIRVLQFDEQAVVKSAQISSDLINKGMKVPDSDCIIAGIALNKGISIIVTRNVKHFERMKAIIVTRNVKHFERMKGIKVETY